MSIETILLAVDDSKHSMLAALHAVDAAHAYGASILVVHCHPTAPSVLGEPNFSQAVDVLIREAENTLKPFQEFLTGQGIAFETRSIGGDPAQVIIDVAKAEPSQLIVMGCRGRGGLTGLLLGSVTHRVLQTAPCPVTVVR